MSKAAANGGSRSVKGAEGEAVPYRRFFWLLACGWTLAVAGSLGWNLVHNAAELKQITFQTAEALLEKDLLYREWSILHGGVYIPRSGATQPPPVTATSDGDVVTPTGQHLTLLNPAIVSREIFALQDEQLGARGHITSLNPVRAANQADAWERRALLAFENGAREVSGTEQQDGRRFFRMMRPLVTVPSCLHCHEESDRKPGQVRGGISVTLPMDRFAAKAQNLHLAVAHGGLWIIGLTGLALGVRDLEKHSLYRKRAEDRTRTALEEKDALLQEIHHRVKNNLQVVSSLLQLQLNDIKDPQTAHIFRESQLRVRSMALIHEKLYQSESLARIDLADYLRSLTSLLLSTYAKAPGRAELQLIVSPVCVTIDAAIPLGLIANELISNCLKFAFPAGRQGCIRVELEREGAGTLRFRVADDGVGLPEGLVVGQSSSLGMRLVRMLSGQLGARGTWDKVERGTSFTLRFRDSECKEMHEVTVPAGKEHGLVTAGA